ncbi:unnamed protein product [Darwinula stevensoni]|uniref:Uncharacterized protein n=1 Tax=Darwinula stevensoni TaxID=69355 RepID=A0A7R9A972_9CRUS|nr:unnamed protein product [Darwinula stevensoni]CAG0896945.1 unnamed protein product [Darwinula stevensoni]
MCAMYAETVHIRNSILKEGGAGVCNILLFRVKIFVRLKNTSWVMRIYTNYKPEIPSQRDWMCGIQCNHSHVDFCLADRLPQLGNITRIQEEGSTWRFLVGMDPLVDIFVSRDSDSVVTSREREAVDEWLKSNSMIHVMRDHPHHPWHILAGMWGAKTFMNRSLMANLTVQMVLKTDLKHAYGFDQEILRLILWPATTHLMV